MSGSGPSTAAKSARAGSSKFLHPGKVAQDFKLLLGERLRVEQARQGSSNAEETSLHKASKCTDSNWGIASTHPDEAQSISWLCDFPCEEPVSSLAVSAGGLVAAGSWDGSVHFFDLARWHDSGILRCAAGASNGLAASPAEDLYNGVDDSKSWGNTAVVDASFAPVWPQHLGLAIGPDVQLWGPGSQGSFELQATLHHKACVTGIDFHSSQSMITSASEEGCISLWDVTNYEQLRVLPCGTDRLVGCRFLGGSQPYMFGAVGVGVDGLAHVWDIRCPARLKCLQGPDVATCVDCHAGKHLLVVGFADGQVASWDMRTWQQSQRLELCPHSRDRACPTSIAVSPCGTFLAAGGRDGELVIFDLPRAGQAAPQVAYHHKDAISAISWLPRPEWVDPSSSSTYCLTCASLDGTWTCWAPRDRGISEQAPPTAANIGSMQ